MHRPFDARLQLIEDKPSDAPSWKTVSLVTALREYLSREPAGVLAPCEEHDDLLRRCADELTERGLDADALVRYGLLPEAIAGILSLVIQEAVRASDGENPDDARARGWLNLVDPRFTSHGLDLANLQTSTGDRFARALTAMLEELLPWMLSAPLDRLIRCDPPDATDLAQARAPDSSDYELLEQYRWAVDRFSVTSFADWATSSLHLELRWMCRSTPAPCAPHLMDEHRPSRTLVEAEIASRAVFPQPRQDHRQIRASLASKMLAQAKAHLGKGNFAEAAALFAFAVAEDPTDAGAYNNLGFCQIPIDADVARRHLERAAELGYAFPDINLYNRVVATYVASGADAALRLAESEWGDLPAVVPSSALLWVVTEAQNLELRDNQCAKESLAQFAERLAVAAQLPDQAALWRSRAA